VQVIIADTGVGFGHGSGKGSGLGLTHVRERLARIFGAAASMQMEENTPRGVVVRLTLPLTRHTELPVPPPVPTAVPATPAGVTPAMPRP
jgi:LytS/YehU family sensor histidine kinase